MLIGMMLAERPVLSLAVEDNGARAPMTGAHTRVGSHHGRADGI